MSDYASCRFKLLTSLYHTQDLSAVKVVDDMPVPEGLLDRIKCSCPQMIDFIGTRELTEKDILGTTLCLYLPEVVCDQEIGDFLETQVRGPMAAYDVVLLRRGPNPTDYFISEGWVNVVHCLRLKAGNTVELWGYLDGMGELLFAMRIADGKTPDILLEYEF